MDVLTVTRKPLEGLGSDVKTLERMCADDKETLSLITQAAKGKQGERTDLIDNVNKVGSSTPEGNSRQAALRSLRKNAPLIHASAYIAMRWWLKVKNCERSQFS
jgi:hypothetical protein